MDEEKSLEDQIRLNRSRKAALKYHPCAKSAKLLDTQHRKLLQQVFDRDNPDAALIRNEKWIQLVAKHEATRANHKMPYDRAEELSKHFEDLYDRVKNNTVNVTSKSYRLYKRVATAEIKGLQAEAAELKKFFKQAQKPL